MPWLAGDGLVVGQPGGVLLEERAGLSDRRPVMADAGEDQEQVFWQPAERGVEHGDADVHRDRRAGQRGSHAGGQRGSGQGEVACEEVGGAQRYDPEPHTGVVEFADHLAHSAVTTADDHQIGPGLDRRPGLRAAPFGHAGQLDARYRPAQFLCSSQDFVAGCSPLGLGRVEDQHRSAGPWHRRSGAMADR